MGLMDEMSSKLNQGVGAASRAGQIAKLNMQLRGLDDQRRNLMASLGASLYDMTKGQAEFASEFPDLYRAIAELDVQRGTVQRQISDLRLAQETASQAVSQPASYAATASADGVPYVCPRYGTLVDRGSKFCSGCGLPIAEVAKASAPQAAPTAPQGQPTCPSCGARVSPGDVFCLNCGARLDLDGQATGQSNSKPAPAGPGAAPAPTEPAVRGDAGASSEPAQQSKPIEQGDSKAMTGDAAAPSALSELEDDGIPGAVSRGGHFLVPPVFSKASEPLTNVPVASQEESAAPGGPAGADTDVPAEPSSTPVTSVGEPAAPKGVTRACPNCGRPVDMGDKFCQKCGFKLV